jgi:protein required for attachment to host cells
MKIEHAAWVLIADSEKFQVFENHGDQEVIDLRVRKYDETPNPPTREQGSDRPGRFPSPHGQSSAVADTDWHVLQKKTAAKDLADKVNKWSEKGDFKSLVLIADPKTLGVMRSHLNTSVSDKILSEIPKDLTHHTVDDIERLLDAA